MKVIYCGELARTPDAPDHKGIIQGLTWLGLDWKIVDPVLFPDKVIEECNNFNADLIIHGNTDSLDHDWIPHIKGRQVFFLGDFQPSKQDYHNWETWKQNSRGIEAIFLSNREQIDLWSSEFGVPTFFWPHGCYVPDYLEYDNNFDRGLIFIGSRVDSPHYRNRIEILEKIQSLTPDFNWITENSVEGRNRIWREMPKLYHSSKAVLDISHYWNVDGYASGRYWYSAGLGGCCISKRFPGCEEFYPKGTKWYFDTPEEAVELYQWLAKHHNIRIATKRKAYEHNKQFHNYKIRFLDLFAKLNIKL